MPLNGPIYTFTAQQPGNSIMCGAFALCALLGQRGIKPSEILSAAPPSDEAKKAYQDPGPTATEQEKEKRAEIVAGLAVYDRVKAVDLANYCSPTKMVDFALAKFGLRLQIKCTQPVFTALNANTNALMKAHAANATVATYARVLGPQILTAVLPGKYTIMFQSLHFLCRKTSGDIQDSGAGNGLAFGAPFTPDSFPNNCYVSWYGLWIE